MRHGAYWGATHYQAAADGFRRGAWLGLLVGAGFGALLAVAVLG